MKKLGKLIWAEVWARLGEKTKGEFSSTDVKVALEQSGVSRKKLENSLFKYLTDGLEVILHGNLEITAFEGIRYYKVPHHSVAEQMLGIKKKKEVDPSLTAADIAGLFKIKSTVKNMAGIFAIFAKAEKMKLPSNVVVEEIKKLGIGRTNFADWARQIGVKVQSKRGNGSTMELIDNSDRTALDLYHLMQRVGKIRSWEINFDDYLSSSEGGEFTNQVKAVNESKIIVETERSEEYKDSLEVFFKKAHILKVLEKEGGRSSIEEIKDKLEVKTNDSAEVYHLCKRLSQSYPELLRMEKNGNIISTDIKKLQSFYNLENITSTIYVRTYIEEEHIGNLCPDIPMELDGAMEGGKMKIYKLEPNYSDEHRKEVKELLHVVECLGGGSLCPDSLYCSLL